MKILGIRISVGSAYSITQRLRCISTSLLLFNPEEFQEGPRNAYGLSKQPSKKQSWSQTTQLRDKTGEQSAGNVSFISKRAEKILCTAKNKSHWSSGHCRHNPVQDFPLLFSTTEPIPPVKADSSSKCWWCRDPIPCSTRDSSYASGFIFTSPIPGFKRTTIFGSIWVRANTPQSALQFLWMLPLHKNFPWDRQQHFCIFTLFCFPKGYLLLSPPGFFWYILLLLFPCYVCSSLSILAPFCSSSAQQLLVSYLKSQ